MRINNPGQDLTFEANADLSTFRFRFVKGVAGPAGGVQARVGLATIGTRSIGVLQDSPNAAGLAARVRISGGTELEVDGTVGGGIVAGAPLKPNAVGRGIVAATDKDKVGAIAMEPSTAAGDRIHALVVQYDLAV